MTVYTSLVSSLTPCRYRVRKLFYLTTFATHIALAFLTSNFKSPSSSHTAKAYCRSCRFFISHLQSLRTLSVYDRSYTLSVKQCSSSQFRVLFESVFGDRVMNKAIRHSRLPVRCIFLVGNINE